MENHMNVSSLRPRLLGSSVLLAAAIALAATVPALADTSTVTQPVTAGVLSASIAGATMTSVPLSHSDQTALGTLSLTADDSTGSAAGWNVTIQETSTFAYTAPVRLHQRGYPDRQPVAGLRGFTGTRRRPGRQCDDRHWARSDSRHRWLAQHCPQGRSATAAYGSGSYTQALHVALVVPGNSRPGTYTGTLTNTISTAP